jgi:hypothetical protein
MLGICGAKWWEQKPIGIYADISETIFGIKWCGYMMGNHGQTMN